MDQTKIKKNINSIKKQLEADKTISPATRATIALLFNLVEILISLIEKLPGQKLNSSNSSIPPSQDPNRSKESLKKKGRKPGGQKGRKGSTLRQVDNPDETVEINVDLSQLPEGKVREAGFITRQVVEIEVLRKVIEYRAQIIIDTNGKQHVAPFPAGVIAPIQYGSSVRAHSVYLSQAQLLPVNRVKEYFQDSLGFGLSEGSIHRFNQLAFDKLSRFEQIAKRQLSISYLIHADETGININGKRQWLHCASNQKWTLFYPHKNRGKLAMDEMGVLPDFQGVLVHDHWTPYFKYHCQHSLCNAHILRELEAGIERDGQKQPWIQEMKNLLITINSSMKKSSGKVSPVEAAKYWQEYEELLSRANVQCPEPPPQKGKRGRVARSKTRNLLERLMNYKVEILRFMEDRQVPFTNNQGENDIRMTKVQQKISGCFRSMDGAKIFCRIRSYLSTCSKNGVGQVEALSLLFKDNKLPKFIEQLDDGSSMTSTEVPE